MTNLLAVDRDSLDYIRQWLTTAWPNTAAQSYDSFKKAGRGLLFIDLANGEPADEFNLGLRARCVYVPVGELGEHSVLDQCSDEDRDRMRDVLASYDPQREAVFAITRRKGGILFFKVDAGDHTPQVAYKRRKKRAALAPALRVVGQG